MNGNFVIVYINRFTAKCQNFYKVKKLTFYNKIGEKTALVNTLFTQSSIYIYIYAIIINI